jgi:hypothetical protein
MKTKVLEIAGGESQVELNCPKPDASNLLNCRVFNRTFRCSHVHIYPIASLRGAWSYVQAIPRRAWSRPRQPMRSISSWGRAPG